MASHLHALAYDAFEPAALGRFWAGVLGRELVVDAGGDVVLLPNGATEIAVRFVPTQEPKTGPNQMHLDLTSTSADDQARIVETALALGGRHLDIGQGPDATHVVLADPDGNELCVIAPGNTFLAGTGAVGALSSDGTYAVGHFWSAALGWPLVWDQDEETAIQSPQGGSKISWGGPPVNLKTGRNRLHLDLRPADGDHEAEVERLLALGATRTDVGEGRPDRLSLADPDGNEFCVLVAR